MTEKKNKRVFLLLLYWDRVRCAHLLLKIKRSVYFFHLSCVESVNTLLLNRCLVVRELVYGFLVVLIRRLEAYFVPMWGWCERFGSGIWDGAMKVDGSWQTGHTCRRWPPRPFWQPPTASYNKAPSLQEQGAATFVFKCYSKRFWQKLSKNLRTIVLQHFIISCFQDTKDTMSNILCYLKEKPPNSFEVLGLWHLPALKYS